MEGESVEDKIMGVGLGLSLFALLFIFCFLYATRNEKEEIKMIELKGFDEHPDL